MALHPKHRHAKKPVSDIDAVETEIRKTYSDEEDEDTLEWREFLEDILEKLESGKRLTAREKANVQQCRDNIEMERILYDDVFVVQHEPTGRVSRRRTIPRKKRRSSKEKVMYWTTIGYRSMGGGTAWETYEIVLDADEDDPDREWYSEWETTTPGQLDLPGCRSCKTRLLDEGEDDYNHDHPMEVFTDKFTSNPREVLDDALIRKIYGGKKKYDFLVACADDTIGEFPETSAKKYCAIHPVRRGALIEQCNAVIDMAEKVDDCIGDIESDMDDFKEDALDNIKDAIDDAIDNEVDKELEYARGEIYKELDYAKGQVQSVIEYAEGLSDMIDDLPKEENPPGKSPKKYAYSAPSWWDRGEPSNKFKVMLGGMFGLIILAIGKSYYDIRKGEK